MLSDATSAPLEQVARLIQLSLTPIFLLSALASLLGVFAGRLARVADRVDQLNMTLETSSAAEAARLAVELSYQRRRTLTLDMAVVLGTIGGALTCASVLVLFIGALGALNVAGLLFALFGLAVLAAIGALAAFGYEMLLASRRVRFKAETGSVSAADVQSTRTSVSASGGGSGNTG